MPGMVEGKVRRYDLCPIVHEVWYDSRSGEVPVAGIVSVNAGTGADHVDVDGDELGVPEDLRALQITGPIFDGEPVDRRSLK